MRKTILVSIISSIASLSLAMAVFGASGALALPSLAELTGIKDEVVNQLISPFTGKIQLKFLPTGVGSGLDVDLLDGLHAESFILKSSFDDFKDRLGKDIDSVKQAVATIDFSPYLKKVEQAADSAKLGGNLPSLFQDATNLISGTLSDLRLSANVALLSPSQTFAALKTFSGGLTVSGGTLTLPAGSITSAFISDGSITGSDLASNISISTTGNLTTAGSGFITSAGLLTANSGFTLSSGTLTLPAVSVSDAALSSNVALLTGAQAFSGTKTFSNAITAPTSTNTINGLIISSGNITSANLTTSTGSLTSTVADGASAVAFTLATSTTYSTSGAKVLSIKNNASELLSLNKDGLLNVNGSIVSTGTIQGTQIISTVATGTAPLVVSSTTQVTNLNAFLLGGKALSEIQANIQVFDSAGSFVWTKPAGAKFVRVIAIGGGGGGGSGQGNTPGTARGGGAAGGGGALVIGEFDASALGTTETVTVGVGGTGGAGSAGSVGNSGGQGGNSSFGSHLTTYGGGWGVSQGINDFGGGGGGWAGAGVGGQSGGAGGAPSGSSTSFGGASGGGSASAGSNGVWGGGGGAGDSPVPTAGAGLAGGSSLYAAGGGASGGGVNASNSDTNGATGGATNSFSNGGGGTAGTSGGSGGAGTSRSRTGKAGDGGGGGAGNAATTGGNGGNGGVPGGGGGGGGGGTNIGGNGGAGGRGEVIVITWF